MTKPNACHTIRPYISFYDFFILVVIYKALELERVEKKTSNNILSVKTYNYLYLRGTLNEVYT